MGLYVAAKTSAVFAIITCLKLFFATDDVDVSLPGEAFRKLRELELVRPGLTVSRFTLIRRELARHNLEWNQYYHCNNDPYNMMCARVFQKSPFQASPIACPRTESTTCEPAGAWVRLIQKRNTKTGVFRTRACHTCMQSRHSHRDPSSFSVDGTIGFWSKICIVKKLEKACVSLFLSVSLACHYWDV